MIKKYSYKEQDIIHSHMVHHKYGEEYYHKYGEEYAPKMRAERFLG